MQSDQCQGRAESSTRTIYPHNIHLQSSSIPERDSESEIKSGEKKKERERGEKK